jgi:hypothetical protein
VRPHDASLARNLALLNPAPAGAMTGPNPGGASHAQPT